MLQITLPCCYERLICYFYRLGALCWRKSGSNDNLDGTFRGRLRMLSLFLPEHSTVTVRCYEDRAALPLGG